jgi:hypothetical protein
MHPTVAAPAEEANVPQLSFELALRLEQFHAKALRGGDEPRLVARMDVVRLFHQAVGGGPVDDGADSSLEDPAVSWHLGHEVAW